jgi:3-hydroxyisobutyrate dehydrogenase-like beta-hydroxyacid dehydrogenase
MGLGMARSLLAAGHEVVGCDVNAAACAARVIQRTTGLWG